MWSLFNISKYSLFFYCFFLMFHCGKWACFRLFIVVSATMCMPHLWHSVLETACSPSFYDGTTRTRQTFNYLQVFTQWRPVVPTWPNMELHFKVCIQIGLYEDAQDNVPYNAKWAQAQRGDSLDNHLYKERKESEREIHCPCPTF